MIRVWHLATLAVLSFLGMPACLSGGDGPLPDGGLERLELIHSADSEPDSSTPEGMQDDVRVIIGLGDDRLQFSPLEEGGEIPLETFGQGGTHASMAVRCIGLGDQAFVDVTLENLETGETVMTPPASRPPLLLCSEGGCDLVPLYVMTGGLADPEEKDGLRIRVTAEARNLDGLSASASVEAILRSY